MCDKFFYKEASSSCISEDKSRLPLSLPSLLLSLCLSLLFIPTSSLSYLYLPTFQHSLSPSYTYIPILSLSMFLSMYVVHLSISIYLATYLFYICLSIYLYVVHPCNFNVSFSVLFHSIYLFMNYPSLSDVDLYFCFVHPTCCCYIFL